MDGMSLKTLGEAGAAVQGLVLGGGGILGGADLLAFRAAGARAVMLYTAMVLRGPLAAALMLALAPLWFQLRGHQA